MARNNRLQDNIFPIGPNEGHFLTAHSAGFRPCRLSEQTSAKECAEEEDFWEVKMMERQLFAAFCSLMVSGTHAVQAASTW